MTSLNLTHKTALITGASKGIGLATAWAFAKAGAHLHLAARDNAALEAARKEIQSHHDVNVQVHALDLSVPGVMKQLDAAVGDVDILINNAGDMPSGPIESLDWEVVRRGFSLKVLGYMELTQHVYARMKRQGHGVIVNDIGNSGENWDANYIAGSTCNAAVMAFTRALGGVSLDDGIRVVGVNPGPVATDRMVKLMKRRALDNYGDEGRWEELFLQYPGGRPAEAYEVADLMLFLASDLAQYITGTIVTIDGGIAARGSIIKTGKLAQNQQAKPPEPDRASY
ncbi:short-chain dehydrogenase/reductase [Variovorax sp. V118]|uniref:SDR family oxidoreductase n=1 Tax=Variovorax sp. V118 TaxID=3065954 RepID=UPI0034E84AB0